jgi:recA bacterial DNA recombination protein
LLRTFECVFVSLPAYFSPSPLLPLSTQYITQFFLVNAHYVPFLHSPFLLSPLLTGSLSRSQTTVIFINQLRSKIGVMYGNPEVTAGGNALKFYSSVRIDIRRKEILKENDGIMVKIKVVKNKVIMLSII